MDLDLLSSKIFNDPYPQFEGIRAAGRVVWNERAKGWMVTSDRLIRNILANPRQFSIARAPSAKVFGEEAFMVIDDRARHDALRGAWSMAFRRDAVENYQTTVRRIVDRLLLPVLDRLRAGEKVDAFEAFCRDIPPFVTAYLLGLPDSMVPDMVRWSDLMAAAIISAPSLDGMPNASLIAGEQAKRELGDYLKAQLAYRRRHPGSDLISQLVQSDVAKRVSDDALMVNCRQLLFAGSETTGTWLAHILVVLHDHPDTRHEIAANRSLIPAFTEEVMRWEPPVHRLHRIVVDGPVELEGIELGEGDLVILLPGAANRDPERYKDPAKFDVHREQISNLGFGFGMHSCLGISLARLEANTMTSRLLDVLSDYHLEPQIGYTGLGLRRPTPLLLSL